jgi:hypothetical protein
MEVSEAMPMEGSAALTKEGLDVHRWSATPPMTELLEVTWSLPLPMVMRLNGGRAFGAFPNNRRHKHRGILNI